MKVNNINLEKIEAFQEAAKKDSSAAKKMQVIEGEWVLDEGDVQFKSTVSFEGGKTLLEMDHPSFLGGSGKRPGPMHYCFYGLAACYTGVFATMASMLGIELKKLTTRVEADANFSRVFGLSDDPAMDEVRVTLNVISDAPEEKIREAEQLAIQRCPVVYTLRNPIKLTPSIEINKVEVLS